MRVETVRRVVWKDGWFCMVGLGGSKANAYLSLFKISGRLKKTVIIGNIHDNPELLEEAK